MVKIETKAEELGVKPQEYVDKMAADVKNYGKRLISVMTNSFVRQMITIKQLFKNI